MEEELAGLRPEVLAALDAWIAEQPDPRPSRVGAMHQIVGEWAASRTNVLDGFVDAPQSYPRWRSMS